MQMNNFGSTHPVVLIAAVAVTIFSLLGSAVITGLIPGVHLGIQGSALKQPMNQSTVSKGTASARQNTPIIGDGTGASRITRYKSKVQPHQVLPGSRTGKDAACNSCGKVVAISTMEQKSSGYMIKIRMGDGSYRTITQYGKPHYSVGDQVKLSNEQLTMA